jgi:hypothetical protein
MLRTGEAHLYIDSVSGHVAVCDIGSLPSMMRVDLRGVLGSLTFAPRVYRLHTLTPPAEYTYHESAWPGPMIKRKTTHPEYKARQRILRDSESDKSAKPSPNRDAVVHIEAIQDIVPRALTQCT